MKKYILAALIFLFIFFSIFHISEEISRESSVKIFVIDSKIDSSFINSPLPRLQTNSSHGSRTAALIRSISRTEIIPLSVENFLGDPSQEGYINALKEVQTYKEAHPEQKILVNISLGFSDSNFQEELIKELSSDNLLIIAAAGNDNREEGSYPAYFSEVMAAAALEDDKKMAESNYGEFIDISAQGTIEINEYFNLPYNSFSRTITSRGTSFAAPQVTALLAKILSYNHELSIKEAAQIMKNTAEAVNDALYAEGKLGAGEININRALREANPLYFWAQTAAFFSLAAAALLLLVGLWQKYSYAALIIFALLAAVMLLSWPFVLILYYQSSYWTIILASAAVIVIYFSFQLLTERFLRKSKNIKALINLGIRFNKRMRGLAVDNIAEGINKKSSAETEELINYLMRKLRANNSREKAEFYLKILSRIELPPFNLIISKLFYFNLKGDFIGKEMAKTERPAKSKSLIIGELFYYLYYDDYKVKNTAAEILKYLKDPLCLIPIKNMLKKRKNFSDHHLFYFLLDILSIFNEQAADFSELLKEIIRTSNDQWLKYHALKAYQNTAVNDQDYRNFLAEIRENEREPAVLALKN